MKLNMTFKQAIGAIYAIDKALSELDDKALNHAFDPEAGEYNRGFRAGICYAVEQITPIIDKYNKEADGWQKKTEAHNEK